MVYAKRMAKDQSISVTVIQFPAPEDFPVDPSMKQETMMDSEALEDVRYSNPSAPLGSMGYVEEVVNDRSKMASMVKSLVEDYDLIITGRMYGAGCPQTQGLTEWSEFPELGVVGDLLASTDIYGRASVLVAQQQVSD